MLGMRGFLSRPTKSNIISRFHPHLCTHPTLALTCTRLLLQRDNCNMSPAVVHYRTTDGVGDPGRAAKEAYPNPHPNPHPHPHPNPNRAVKEVPVFPFPSMPSEMTLWSESLSIPSEMTVVQIVRCAVAPFRDCPYPLSRVMIRGPGVHTGRGRAHVRPGCYREAIEIGPR